jgi:hypothetical protein
LVAGFIFNFQSHGLWLQAQLKLGSLFFFQLLQTWLVAASSFEALYLIISSIFKVLVRGCKLS